MSSVTHTTRLLTSVEHSLACYMLANGKAASPVHVAQLEDALASTWVCPCGCASFNLVVPGIPEATGGMTILRDYVFGSDSTLAGAFIFARDGVIGGVEIYGLAGDAPTALPLPSDLRPFADTP